MPCDRQTLWFSLQMALLLSFKNIRRENLIKDTFKVIKPDVGSLPDLHGQLQPYFVLLCVYVIGS